MNLSIQEKKILYAFACPNHHNTVTRLKWLTALTVDSNTDVLERLSKVEASAKQAHHRLDGVEQTIRTGGNC